MAWDKELEELKRRSALAEKMGGDEKLKRQADRGKLNVRERLLRLVDKESFREIGKLSGRAAYNDDGSLKDFMAANFLFGRANVEGRPIVATGDDFTVRGGAADAAIWQKMVAAEQMAHELRLPLVRMIDGTGGGGSVKTLNTSARTYVPANPGWDWVVRNMATVPVVALGLGPVAGLGAARLVTSHFSVMVKALTQVFVAGPPVVKRLGEDVDKEGLGGAHIHAHNGVVDAVAESEDEAIEMARRFLTYLPSSVDGLPPRTETTDDPNREDEALVSVVPEDRRKVYKMRKIINSVVDQDSFFEMGKLWGRSAITGFARLDGWPVAVLANDPYHYGGGWTADAAQKIVRFIDLAETFHLPVVHLVDNPGFVIGIEAERAGTIRHGCRALAAVYQASVPWCSILIRKAFGVAGAANLNHSRFHYRFAWPSGDWGSLPLEGGIEAAYQSELEQAEDPDALRAEIESAMNEVRSPFRTAEAFLVEDIIDPRKTRSLLCEFAELAAPLRKAGPVSFPIRP